MSLNNTPNADRVHIGIFGRRNAGKSSIINAVTGQDLAIVSDVQGTTTDPVSKAMELLPLGPVVIIDTPGLDDTGELGEIRISKTYQVLNKTDIALLVVDGTSGITDYDKKILSRIEDKKIPYLIVYNKSDLITRICKNENEIAVSAKTNQNIHELKERIAALVPDHKAEYPIIADKVENGDCVVLVIPIDSSAPKGRLILPQQQTIRELLDCGCTVLACRDSELSQTLDALENDPKYVITDSQAFGKVSKIVPDNVCLTSFSILFARHKGTKKQVDFEFTSGTEFPFDLSKYSLIVHCGGCMLNEREMKYRIKCAQDAGVPITNYGMTIAHTKGILKRSMRIFANNVI